MKPILIPDSDNCPVYITYFTFRSVVSAANINSRAPVKMLSKSFLILSTAPYSAKPLFQLVWVAHQPK